MKKSKLQVEEIHFVGFLSKLIETKIVQVLRFEHGQVCILSSVMFGIISLLLPYPPVLQIYSAGVSVFLGGNKPSRKGDVRGDICINFSCDPEISSKLVRLMQDIFHVPIFGFND